MKKITFILFTLIAGTTFGQNFDSAVVNAEIVSPITVSSTADLEFGLLASPTADTNITIDDAGVRNTVTGVTLSGTATTAAKFDITAANTYAYTISILATDLTADGGSGGADMTLTLLSDNPTLTATGNGSAQELIVGGTLTVNALQAADTYTGSAKVTVNYN